MYAPASCNSSQLSPDHIKRQTRALSLGTQAAHSVQLSRPRPFSSASAAVVCARSSSKRVPPANDRARAKASASASASLLPSHSAAFTHSAMASHSLASSPVHSRQPSESTPLLLSPGRSRSGAALAPPPSPSGSVNSWNHKLKKRTSAFSDLLSGGNHSSWAQAPSTLTEESSVEDEELVAGGSAGGGAPVGRRTTTRGYDGDFKTELEGEGGNGLRIWYDNYVGIDWIHDSIKNSIRARKLRARRVHDGLRGRIVNVWDGGQGWLLVTIVGLVTACIAWGIVRGEMLLFDLKDGFCTGQPHLAKRFCCKERPVPGTTRAGSLLAHYSIDSMKMLEEEVCAQWITWGELWERRVGGEGSLLAWAVDYAAFILLALAFALTASVMTIYLTSSATVFSSKDSASVPHPGFSPDFLSLTSAQSTVQSTPPELGYGTTLARTIDQPKVENGKLEVPHTRPRKVTYFAAGSGLPQVKVILSGFVIRGYLGSWTLGVKAVGLALSVASGLSLGKEGPFVHIASCVANITSRFFPKYDLNEAKRREIISAACAAGVAVSFGAPVGGTLFSLEETSYYFPAKVMWRSFWCAMVAAMFLKLLDPFGSGKIVLLEVYYDQPWKNLEVLGFLFLGVFGGVYGALFNKANAAWSKWFRSRTWWGRHPIAEVALITLITVAISFYNPYTKMGGTELVSSMYAECVKSETLSGLCIRTPEEVWPLVRTIVFALAAKAILTVVTFGMALPAGVFIPTLAVGACAGRISGLLVELVHARHPDWSIFNECRAAVGDGPLPFGQACVVPGVWAMVGSAATLAGVTRTTVSLAVIMFELTGSLGYVTPVMGAVLVAKIVADAIEPMSVYDLVIHGPAQLPYLDAKVEYVHELNPADILDADAPVINLDDDNTWTSLRDKLEQLYSNGSGGGFPIVAREEGGRGLRHFGYVAAKELEYGLAQSARVQSANTPCTFRTTASLRDGTSASFASLPMRSRQPTGSEGFDLSFLVDVAPITVNIRSPMELCHEMFAKLGVRYLLVVDERGIYRGVIEKNRYLAYIKWLELQEHRPRRPSQ